MLARQRSMSLRLRIGQNSVAGYVEKSRNESIVFGIVGDSACDSTELVARPSPRLTRTVSLSNGGSRRAEVR